MKNRIRQLAVLFSVALTLLVNGLANTLPLNGLYTGQVSERFNVLFTPAGYVFSIWGVIYLGLITSAIFQAFPSQQFNPRLQAAGWWVVAGGMANSTWLFLWHYQQLAWTVPVMLVLLLTLIIAYLKLQIGRTNVSKFEKWSTHVTFSIYLGWITVATIANITLLLDDWRWDRFGLSPETWMVIILFVICIITAWVNFTRRDIAYTLVILWALAGISIRQGAVVSVNIAVRVAFTVVLLSLLIALYLSRVDHNRQRTTV